jgi:hypothetical protein
MRLILPFALLCVAGCPNKATDEQKPKEEVNRNPYRNVTPQKVKSDVEAAQKKEEDRDDRILDKAKQ